MLMACRLNASPAMCGQCGRNLEPGEGVIHESPLTTAATVVLCIDGRRCAGRALLAASRRGFPQWGFEEHLPLTSEEDLTIFTRALMVHVHTPARMRLREDGQGLERLPTTYVVSAAPRLWQCSAPPASSDARLISLGERRTSSSERIRGDDLAGGVLFLLSVIVAWLLMVVTQ